MLDMEKNLATINGWCENAEAKARRLLEEQAAADEKTKRRNRIKVAIGGTLSILAIGWLARKFK